MYLSKFFFSILVMAAAAQADTITLFFTALPPTLQSYDTGSGSATYNGYATATIAGIPSQSVICDDYSHDTYVPSSSNLIYDYSTLTGSTPLQYARFTGLNETQNYEIAAVLLVGLSNYLASGHATGTGITDYQYAIWNLFTPNSQSNPSGAPANANQLALQTSALSVVNTGGQVALGDYQHLVIYTPTEPYASNQEFLGLNTPVGQAPEPSAAPLLALLLGVAGTFAHLRHARSRKAN
jgi:hypothetical protein